LHCDDSVPDLARSALGPYTTLFRSHAAAFDRGANLQSAQGVEVGLDLVGGSKRERAHVAGPQRQEDEGDGPQQDEEPYPEIGLRSEEHTSELQSREKLVCRLLREKK